jgi:hypothetical protein
MLFFLPYCTVFVIVADMAYGRVIMYLSQEKRIFTLIEHKKEDISEKGG